MRRHGVDTLVNLVGNTFAPLAALATAPILAQALGTVGRGELAGATAPLLLAASCASLGLPSAVNHWVARHAGHSRRMLGIAAVATAAIGVIVTAAIVVAGDAFAAGDPELSRLISAAALALVPNLQASVLQAIAAGRHAWRLVALERAVTNGTRLAALATLSAAHALSVETAVLVIALTPVIGAVVYLPLIVRPVERVDERARIGAVLSYGGRVWFGALAGIILTRIDQTLMIPLAGAAALGVYALAVNLADIPLTVANAVREVTFSRQSERVDHEVLARSSRLTGAAVVLACAGIAAALPWAVPTLFGPTFEGAVPVTLVLLAGCAVSVPGSLAGVGLAAAGRPGLRSTSLAAAAVVNVVLLILLAPGLGAIGAAVATLSGSLVSNGLNLLFVHRVSGLAPAALVGLRRADLRAFRRSV